MKKVALITLHGMGMTDRHYFDELEAGLRKRLRENWESVSFQNVQYGPILQDPEDELWNAMIREKKNSLDAIRLRQFFLYGFADAGSLEFSGRNNKKKYRDVQKEIRNKLDNAYKDLADHPTKPVVIIAQSLGCQVISNYLWDAQHNAHIFKKPALKNRAHDEFRRLKTLHNLVTTGCNIPLFIAGLDDRKCFKKPSDAFRWDNYYDPDDVLGWPLRQLGASYSIVNDHPINAGGLLTFWNPMSHTGYWKDADVLDPLEKILGAFL